MYLSCIYMIAISKVRALVKFRVQQTQLHFSKLPGSIICLRSASGLALAQTHPCQLIGLSSARQKNRPAHGLDDRNNVCASLFPSLPASPSSLPPSPTISPSVAPYHSPRLHPEYLQCRGLIAQDNCILRYLLKLYA